jgi:predicted enzyme related to lactoylglutathione lyase
MSTKEPETADKYEMPPRDGFTITLFITVADINRSADFYEKVFGGRILSRGDTRIKSTAL